MKLTLVTDYCLVFFLSLLTFTLTTIPAGAQNAPAASYSFKVNVKDDSHDAHPGDGKCADKARNCSLRAAIEEADALPSGSSSTITLPKGMYNLDFGTLVLTGQHSITLNGSGKNATTINGGKNFAVMSINDPNVSASISQLTIEQGWANGRGGGIYNGGTLNISKSTLYGNTTNFGISGEGGGIYNTGTLTVDKSTFNSNAAYGAKYNAYGLGGGIFNTGTATVSNSTFIYNSAIDTQIHAFGEGGGIYNSGSLNVSNSTFSNNTSHGNSAGYGGGGGIFSTSGGTVSISGSVFSNNSSDNGGGIDNYYGGTMNVSNSSISGNSATSGGGIGIDSSTGTMSVSNSTISGNSATNGGGIDNNGSSILTLAGSIVANSSTGSNCYGTITEGAGYNLDSDGSCGLTLSSDINNTDPMLGPLGNNGGPTQTMALLQGSPAIDWVAVSSCPATDQRGYARPDNGESSCDIGAYESAY